MSDITKFRIKYGELEIEMEGENDAILSQYEKALELVMSQKMKAPQSKKPESKVSDTKKTEKTDSKRGGVTRPKWSPLLDDLIAEGFFDTPNQRSIDDILNELEKKGIPLGQTARNGINTALPRKVRNSKLERAKDEKGQWKYYCT